MKWLIHIQFALVFRMVEAFSVVELRKGWVVSSRSQMYSESVDAMRSEIEQLREDALQRLAKLNEQVARKRNATTLATSTILKESPATKVKGTEYQPLNTNIPAVVRKPAITRSKDDQTLLEGTTWNVMLNIGRETGTWMPKDWGASGERLVLNMKVKFTSQQLYDREDFLDGIAGAKVLAVVDHQVELGPSMNEGARIIPVRNGGWKVSQDGPSGSSLLRFYVEVMEEATHGSDVNCPKGRVYCTCGYFPQSSVRSGYKERVRRQRDESTAKVQALRARLDQDNFFSWEKLGLLRDLFQENSENERLSKMVSEAEMKEPDRSFLRFSDDSSIGLSREGGVCCKVQKGLAIEYHILGRFGISFWERNERK